jgi:Holliday junction DNA helicase RuvB
VAGGVVAAPEALDARLYHLRAGFPAGTPRGRVATPAAWAHLGMPAPTPRHGPTLFDA